MSKVEGAVLLTAVPAPGEGRSAAGTDQGETKPATFRCHGDTGLRDPAAGPGHQGLETRQRARPEKLALAIERIRSAEIVVPVVLIGIRASSAMAGSGRCALLRDTVPDQSICFIRASDIDAGRILFGTASRKPDNLDRLPPCPHFPLARQGIEHLHREAMRQHDRLGDTDWGTGQQA